MYTLHVFRKLVSKLKLNKSNYRSDDYLRLEKGKFLSKFRRRTNTRAGPQLWSSLSESLRTEEYVVKYRGQLKELPGTARIKRKAFQNV